MKLNSGRPIDAIEEDLLGREQYAIELAASFCRWNVQDCFTISLNGPWGSGKSSIWRMCREELQRQPNCAPHLIEFSPWEIGSQEVLAADFLGRIAAKLDEIYGKDHPSKLPQVFRRYAGQVSSALGAIGTVAEIGEAAGVPAAGGIGKATEWFQKWSSSRVSRDELRNSLAHELRDLGRPILIVVDDIDRLTSDEINLLFKLLKAHLDLPRFIYLLLFDREYVARALGRLTRGRGNEFLEKIVQLSLHVPDPSDFQIGELLRKGFDEIRESSPDANRLYEEDRVETLIDDVLLPRLRHVRDVNRYLNAVRFHLQMFIRQDGLEVNPVDLAGIEAIRFFEPEAHLRLPRLSYLLLGAQSWFPKVRERERQDGTKALMSLVRGEVSDWWTKVLQLLFPANPSAPVFNDQEQLLRYERVGHPRCFDKYFRFVLEPENIGRGVVKNLLLAASHPEELTKFLLLWQQRGALSSIIERLVAHEDDFDANSQNVVQAIFNIGDHLDDGDGLDWEGMSQEIRLTKLIRGLLVRELDIDLRAEKLLSAIQNARELHLVVEIAKEELLPEYRKEIEESSRLIAEARLGDLKSAVVAKFVELQNAGITAYPSRATFKLYLWREWSDVHGPRMWVESRLESRDVLVDLLALFVREKDISPREKAQYIDRELLASFVDFEKVQSARTAFFSDAPEGRAGEIVRLFDIAYRLFKNPLKVPAE